MNRKTRECTIPPIVLIVEDDDDTRELYAIALKLAGMWVLQAGSVAEALAAASELKPDVIVTDISFAQRSDGFDLVRQVRANGTLSRVPVIAVTGWDIPDAPATAGFTEILRKPVTPDILIDRVQRQLSQAA